MRPMIECKKKRTEHKYLLLLYILIAACSSDTDHQTQTNSDTLYDNEIYNPKISIYQDKDLAVSSNSKKLIKDDGQDAILIGDVISRFFDDEGGHISTLYSDSAIVENVSNNLRAFGNVTVVSDSGYTLKSREIIWNNQYKLVTSKDSVTFTSSDLDTLYGVGFESDMDLTNSKIYKPYGILNERKR